MPLRIGILVSHPVQYLSPWYRSLAKLSDLQVFYAHRQSAQDNSSSGFGLAFEWDHDLLAGYESRFLRNTATKPSVDSFFGCDTPDIREHIRNGEFDVFVVTGWGLKTYWQAASACKRYRVPLIARGDSHLLVRRPLAKRIVKRLVFPRLLRSFSGFLSVGARFSQYLVHYGVPLSRIRTVPHSVDPQWFERANSLLHSMRAKTRAELNIAESDFVLLFVGKMIDIKNPGDVLQAMQLLGKYAGNLCGVFVGSGPLESQLRARAAKLNLNVRFLGFQNQSELPRYYAAADLLVLPSQSETWGLVVNEAMACGLPAAISDTVGCGLDLIEDGVTGTVFSPGCIDQVAAAIERMQSSIAGHRTSRARIRKAAERFKPDVAAALTIEALRDLVSKPRCD